jgi:hypothetical protein
MSIVYLSLEKAKTHIYEKIESGLSVIVEELEYRDKSRRYSKFEQNPIV